MGVGGVDRVTIAAQCCSTEQDVMSHCGVSGTNLRASTCNNQLLVNIQEPIKVMEHDFNLSE